MTLKEKLLSLDLVIDNEYLDKYCELIESNKNTKREKFKTQKHHIIPRYYYKYNNLEIDNSKENLVNLLYKDHILAHYYLCMCSIYDYYSYINYISVYRIINKDKNDNTIFKDILYTLDDFQKIYEYGRELSLKYNPMFNDKQKFKHNNIMRSEEIRNKISNTMKEKIAKGYFFTEEHRKNLSKQAKESIYMYKDNIITRVVNSKIQQYIDNGWQKYEKRSYKQKMQGINNFNCKFNMFDFRSIKCYCILENGSKYYFNNILTAGIWWFKNYRPFGDKYVEVTLRRKIKDSINGKDIIYKLHNKIIKINYIKWFKSKEGDDEDEVNKNKN